MISSEIKENTALFGNLWEAVGGVLSTAPQGKMESHDPKLDKLFIFSLKDLRKLLDMFDSVVTDKYKREINNALSRDIVSFTKPRIDRLIDLKFSIDWVNRIIMRLLYTRRLLQFCSKGQMFVNNHKMKQEKIASNGLDASNGPYAHLDNIIHFYNWYDEEPNLKGRDRDIRNQHRYTDGFEQYNQPGVGEGRYYRELDQEPFDWYKREEDSPYKGWSSAFWN